MTRMIFSSSAISAVLFCSRPAVSMRSTSWPFARAWLSASQARPAASAPCSRARTGAPVRSPQILSCFDRRRAEGVAGCQHHGFAVCGEFRGELADRGGLAGAVDPDHQDDEGFVRGIDGERLRHRGERLLDLLGQDALDPLPGAISLSKRPSPIFSVMRIAAATPRSAWTSTSSSSSSVCASSLRLVKMPVMPAPIVEEVRDSPSVRRFHQERLTGAGSGAGARRDSGVPSSCGASVSGSGVSGADLSGARFGRPPCRTASTRARASRCRHCHHCRSSTPPSLFAA